jgi:pyochelin biosynthetic protein PchC
MADRVTAALTAVGDLPTSLFGHSMGASVGFEVTRRMCRAGRTPRMLFVSGSTAPGDRAGTDRHTLPDAEFLAEVGRLGGIPPEVAADAQLRELILPALRVDYRLVETYAPAPDARVDVPIVAYGGNSDPVVTVGQLCGWAAATTASFDHVVFPGGHFYLQDHRDEVVRDVVARSRGDLVPAAAGHPAAGRLIRSDTGEQM